MAFLHNVSEGAGFCEGGGGYLAEEPALLRKYRHWRGRSGRSYVFSVYAAQDCPPYEDAVVMVVARGRPLACVDLGPLPLSTLEALRRGCDGREAEFHIHVLADRGADRRAMIADLNPAA